MCSALRDVCFVPITNIDRSITPTVSDDLVNFDRRRTQPPGIDRQPCRHWACSKSQLRLAGKFANARERLLKRHARKVRVRFALSVSAQNLECRE